MMYIGPERVCQGLRDQDRRVRVVALPEIQQSRQPRVGEIAEVGVVEAVLGAAEGQDHGVVVECARELREILALVLAPVAAADDEDPLQLARLDGVDHLTTERSRSVTHTAYWSGLSKLRCSILGWHTPMSRLSALCQKYNPGHFNS